MDGTVPDVVTSKDYKSPFLLMNEKGAVFDLLLPMLVDK